MKKLLSLLLCLALLLSLALPALAEEGAEGQNNASGSPGSSGDENMEEGSQICRHTWVTLTTPATCTAEGSTITQCSLCGGVNSVVTIKMLAHTYDNACDPDCNVCKTARTVEHKLSAGWEHNSTKHWHPCSICGYQGDLAYHYPGPAATEEQDQLCLTCGALMTPKIVHIHDYGTGWVSDEKGHWYGCAGCGETKDFDYHAYDDLCDPDCNICGYQPPTAHSFDETYTSDASGHWTVCVLCGEATQVHPHVPGAEATETTAQVCTLCGYEIVPAKVHVHTYGESWSSDEESHWQTCACGEVSGKASHAWEETEGEGVRNFRCPLCNAQRTEPTEEESSPSSALLFALIAGVAAALGCVVALIFLLKPKKKK